MCETCGCEGDGAVVHHPGGEHTHVLPDGRVVRHSHAHEGHDHGHAHPHPHAHAEPDRHRFVRVEPLGVRVLARNDASAARNRRELASRGVFALNLMSSPGAGKTTLLTKTLPPLLARGPVAVVEGDQATSIDGDRIAATGAPVVQINTGKGCHLEADMLHTGLEQLAPGPGTLLVVENVGNLVCPALFDLGEGARVVLLSVTEGDDKPAKYPHMFSVADLVVFTKIDLLPHVDFDVARARDAVTTLNPRTTFLEVSARTGAGMDAWIDWLDARRPTATEPDTTEGDTMESA